MLLKEQEAQSRIPTLGKEVTLKARVLSIEKRGDEEFRMILRDETYGGKVLLSYFGTVTWENGYGDLAGRTMTVKGTLSLPEKRRNPKTFDYRNYLTSKGIRAVISGKPGSVEMAKEENLDIFINALSRLKCGFLDKLSQTAAPEHAGLLAGMLFGDKNLLEEEVYEQFQKNGTAHVLAVSGIHVGILYMCVAGLLGRRKSRVASGVILLVVFLYVALSGFAPSAIRAGGMIGLHLTAGLLYRRYDLATAGGAVGMGQLLWNPFTLFDPGFLLSYVAIFTLAVILPAADRIKGGFLCAGISLQAGMIPVMAFSFNTFSLVAVLANLPVVFLAGLLIPMGLLLIPLSGISEPLYSIGLGAAEILCRVMLALNDLAYSPGKSFLYVVSPPLWMVFFCYGILFFICSEGGWIRHLRKKRREQGLICFMILLFSLLMAFPHIDGFRDAQIVFVDVGQGDCIHIRTPRGKNILIDSGGSESYDVGKKVLLPYLLKNGVSGIDLALITHRHQDHYGGLVSLARQMPVERLCLYAGNQALEEEILAETGLSPDKLLYASAGDRIEVEEGISIEILSPEGAKLSEDENEISLVVRVNYGEVSVLVTGDIDQEGERRLLAAVPVGKKDPLRTDILKVAHHGSKFGSSEIFLNRAAPKAAVIQVGRNNFGHPTPETLDRLETSGTQVYRNDLQGAIGVFMRKGKEKAAIRTFLVEKAGEK